MQELERPGHRQLVGRHVIGDRRRLVAHLDVRTELAEAGHHRLAVGRRPEFDGAYPPGVDLAEAGRDLGVQTDVSVRPEVEGVQPRNALGLTVGDVIEVVFHARREVVVDQAGEVLFQQVGDSEGTQRRYQRRALLEHVLPLDGLHDGGVCGGPAHAVFLHPLDERGLGVAGRGLGGVAFCGCRHHVDGLTNGHRRKHQLCSVAVIVVGGLSTPTRGFVTGPLVSPAKSLMLDDGTAGRQRGTGTGPVGTRARRQIGPHPEANCLADGVGHLGGNGAAPHQLVDVGLRLRKLATDRIGMTEAVAGRPNGLVSLLGVTDLVGVGPGRVGDVVGTEAFGGLGPGGPHRRVRQRGAVGPHVGDVPLLVQALGGMHGP